LKQDLASGLQLAVRGRLARELSQIADRMRFLYGLDASATPRLKSLDAHCRTFWEKRALILEKLGARLDPDIDQCITTDLLDLAILGSNLRVQLARNTTEARRDALQILKDAEASAGPNAVLYHERRLHAEALGLADIAHEAQRLADACPPRSAWEHYALGRSLLQHGELEAAARQFERALHLQPQGVWPNFYHGICCYRLGRFEDAALANTVCITLAPRAPACYLNRGLAFVARGQSERALRDFDRALELDEVCAEALLQRGLLHFRESKFSLAVADLHRALQNGADPVQAHLHLARAHLAQKNRAAAITHLELAQAANPTHADTAALLKSLRNQR
jgi:tetratricopeptide (TPR) repeat protein